MALFTNLLRKLRFSKTSNDKEKISLNNESYRASLLRAIKQNDSSTGFQGDLFNGWEEDGEPGTNLRDPLGLRQDYVQPTAWHTDYIPKKKK